MRGGWGRTLAAGVTGAAILGTPQWVAEAQELPSGLSIVGSVRSTLEFDDNVSLDPDSPDSDVVFGTDLELGIVSETPSSRLALSFGGTLQQENRDSGEERNGFIDPFVEAAFQTEGATSRLSLEGSIRTRDLEDVAIDDPEDFLDEDLIISGGELELTDLEGTFEVGVGAPVGAALSYSFSERDYQDTADPDLFDRRTSTVRLTGFAQINPVARARAFVSQTDYEADDAGQTERLSRSVGAGVEYEINPVLRFDGEIFFAEVEETALVLGSPVTVENDGAGLEMTLTRDLKNGALTFSASRNVSTFTTRNEVRVGRELQLPNGDLALSLGVSDTDDGDPVLVGSVDYSTELPRGVLSASLARDATINDENESRTRTFARIAYDHELTPVSSVQMGLSVARSEIVTGGVDESTTSTDFEVTYARQLTEDWDWRIGYRGRYRDESDGDSATSNALITSIGRSFSIRP